ncbi:MAG: ATP-binding region ATPase domain protein [Gemmatimonadetes bacterium]|jgi:signal transduction histidine kinase|nr:ATP-binding region ATPase domain protein [Gemmatimonadota bacterium]
MCERLESSLVHRLVMSTATETHPRLAELLAAELRGARTDVVRRWLDRIVARVTVDAGRVFPTEELLNHVPLLVDGIADYLESETGALEAKTVVDGKAMELGALRHQQGFDAYEILKEHEILAGILYTFMREALDRVDSSAVEPTAVAFCWHRVAEATERIRQSTMMHFLRLAAEQVRLREERLRRFNRMVSHELKNRVGAIRGASTLLAEPWLEPEQTLRFQRIIAQNGEGLQRVLENLTALSRLDGESRQQRNVLLPQAAAEVVRQLRDAAKLGDVVVELDDGLPTVEVDAAAVELALTNYISNAIKYANKSRTSRWVRVSGELQVSTADRDGELVVRVHDNGLGVPASAREHLFEQFFRAHGETVTGVEGTGLGLSIVQETIVSLGGRAWAEFPDEGGSVFAFSLPSRREEDAAAAGTRRPDSAAVVV